MTVIGGAKKFLAVTSGVTDADARRVIAKMGTKPAPFRARAIERLIRDWKNAGLWNITQEFFIASAHSKAAAAVNWKADTNNLVDDGTPDFVLNHGFRGSANGTMYFIHNKALAIRASLIVMTSYPNGPEVNQQKAMAGFTINSPRRHSLLFSPTSPSPIPGQGGSPAGPQFGILGDSTSISGYVDTKEYFMATSHISSALKIYRENDRTFTDTIDVNGDAFAGKFGLSTLYSLNEANDITSRSFDNKGITRAVISLGSMTDAQFQTARTALNTYMNSVGIVRT